MTMIVKLKCPRTGNPTSAVNTGLKGCSSSLPVQKVPKPEPSTGKTTDVDEYRGGQSTAGREVPKAVKPNPENSKTNKDDRPDSENDKTSEDDRRKIRSKYLAVKSLINDEKDDISKANSNKFDSIFGQVESLHKLVQKPREQVADAEALLDLAKSLALSVKSFNNDGITPSDFVTFLLQGFKSGVNPRSSMVWGDIGLAVADIFRKVPGYCTMSGVMNNEIKQRKTATRQKRVRPTGLDCPEELNKTAEEKTDTDKNMATMFEILKRKKSVKLEHLVLNRKSFAQTVENIFALSFLVKDGRIKMTVDKSNCQLVSPRNAPAASAVLSGDVSYTHFVFRLDFKDWKMMIDLVGEGEELMPHRGQENISKSSGDPKPGNTRAMSHTTSEKRLCRRDDPLPNQLLVRKEPSERAVPCRSEKRICRNDGLVLNEHLVKKEPSEKHAALGLDLPDWAVTCKRTRNVKRKLKWVL